MKALVTRNIIATTTQPTRVAKKNVMNSEFHGEFANNRYKYLVISSSELNHKATTFLNIGTPERHINLCKSYNY